MADPVPPGDTSFRAIVLAISAAEPLNVPRGGCVESVLTVRTHFRRLARGFAIVASASTATSFRRHTDILRSFSASLIVPRILIGAFAGHDVLPAMSGRASEAPT